MYNFDVEKTKNNCVNWIRQWFKENGDGCKAVIGISGGVDSSVVAALCVEAIGKDRVVGVLMPDGIQSDIKYSHMLCKHLDIKNYIIDISVAAKPLLDFIYLRTDLDDISEQTKINLPPRIRMTTLYAISQSINGRVANTCNLSEDYIGYSTRYGDSAGDFSPLGDLTKTEVIAIGKSLKLPDALVYKVPSDGLCGKTDEDNFGFTYKVLDNYIRTKKIEDLEIKEKIDDMHNKNKFKLELMPYFKN